VAPRFSAAPINECAPAPFRQFRDRRRECRTLAHDQPVRCERYDAISHGDVLARRATKGNSDRALLETPSQCETAQSESRTITQSFVASKSHASLDGML
jgi:hypothetical protein